MTLKETILRHKRITATDLTAVDDVSFDVPAGQAVGIIGQNGCGKSTLLKIVAGIIPPSRGSVEVAGSVASLLELGTGFHPDFTGRENVYLNAAIYGLNEAAVDERIDRIIEFSELEDFVDRPVRTYSSGMYMRLAFAVASDVDADILLLDEVLAVGDESFQRKCHGRIFQFRRDGGTIVFVSHDPGAVELICERVLYLTHGHLVFDGPPAEALARYHEDLAAASVTSAARPEPPKPVIASQTHGVDARSGSYGNGKVVVTGVRLRSAAGDEISGFVGGDTFAIELDYRFIDPTVPEPKFVVRVSQLNGEVLFGTNTFISDVLWQAPRPVGSVVLRCANAPIRYGRFLLTVGVCAADDSELYHTLENWLEFSVFAPGNGEGVMIVPQEWTASASEVVPVSQAGLS